jgi:hypothetical protein
MLFISVLHHYLLWHYGRAFAEIYHVWKNLFWFVINFFSLPQLIRSFFAPWKRMTEERGNSFSFEDLAGFIIVNLISRLIGMMLRTMVIVFGIASLLLLSLGIVLTYIFWVTAPIIIAGCLYYGIVLLFK